MGLGGRQRLDAEEAFEVVLDTKALIRICATRTPEMPAS
jgi:hypothetical protein